MSKYIDADKLIAEIERRQAKLLKTVSHRPIHRMDELESLLSFIDSLLQEQPEVDLEKDIDKYLEPIEAWQIQEAPFTSIENIARHFYELGRARKED